MGALAGQWGASNFEITPTFMLQRFLVQSHIETTPNPYWQYLNYSKSLLVVLEILQILTCMPPQASASGTLHLL